MDEPLVGQRQPKIFYYEADGLGSITSLTDPTGAVAATYIYNSFGFLTNSTGSATNWFRYTARQFDSDTALYNYRARYYDPMTGRFLSEDPVRFNAGVNFYQYASNHPTDYVDPSGLDIAVIENGPTQGNPFGHTAIAVTGQGVFSFGNGVDLGSSLSAYLLQQTIRRDTTVYVLQTSPTQDAADICLGPTSRLPKLGERS